MLFETDRPCIKSRARMLLLLLIMCCCLSSLASGATGEGISPYFRLNPYAFNLGSYGSGVSNEIVIVFDSLNRVWADSNIFEVNESLASADAGEDTWAYESSPINEYVCVLDASRSVRVLTYRWRQIEGTPVVLRNAETAIADFDAPQPGASNEFTRTEANLVFRLTINEGQIGERSDDVLIYVRIPGDATGDDVVNAFDLARLRRYDIRADFTGDGYTNAFDLAILRQNSGRKRTVD